MTELCFEIFFSEQHKHAFFLSISPIESGWRRGNFILRENCARVSLSSMFHSSLCNRLLLLWLLPANHSCLYFLAKFHSLFITHLSIMKILLKKAFRTLPTRAVSHAICIQIFHRRMWILFKLWIYLHRIGNHKKEPSSTWLAYCVMVQYCSVHSTREISIAIVEGNFMHHRTMNTSLLFTALNRTSKVLS